ncbi:MAG: beta-ketoacyl synthase chain length factor [Bacteroidota bacterium]
MYIHHSTCISAQQTFSDVNLEIVNSSEDNVLKIIEPKYEGIPLGTLRRMGKAVRMGVGCALPLISMMPKIDGIVIGTANGGMEDCIKFLNQIVQYEEGSLTPTNFVQSTPNAIAAQIGLLTKNHAYNITHVHRGLAFENALLDVIMLLKENIESNYLVGGLDEISSYNYNIELLANWFKTEAISNKSLYDSNSAGSIAGEAASMFLVNNNKENAIAEIIDLTMIHTNESAEVLAFLKSFCERNMINIDDIDLLISGENGDCRLSDFFQTIENSINENAGICRFKHFSGEFSTASAFALWLSCEFIQKKNIPTHFIKRKSSKSDKSNLVLIYNTNKALQHSFYLLK